MTNNKMEFNPSDSIEVNQTQSEWDNAFTNGTSLTYNKPTAQLIKEKEQRNLAAMQESEPDFSRTLLQAQIDDSVDPDLINKLQKVLDEEYPNT